MKVKMVSLTKEEVAKRDYRDMLVIYINDEKVFEVSDGEPEDANLSRDFNDCWGITDLLIKAHQAGLNGEPLDIEDVAVSIEDM